MEGAVMKSINKYKELKGSIYKAPYFQIYLALTLQWVATKVLSFVLGLEIYRAQHLPLLAMFIQCLVADAAKNSDTSYAISDAQWMEMENQWLNCSTVFPLDPTMLWVYVISPLELILDLVEVYLHCMQSHFVLCRQLKRSSVMKSTEPHHLLTWIQVWVCSTF